MKFRKKPDVMGKPVGIVRKTIYNNHRTKYSLVRRTKLRIPRSCSSGVYLTTSKLHRHARVGKCLPNHFKTSQTCSSGVYQALQNCTVMLEWVNVYLSTSKLHRHTRVGKCLPNHFKTSQTYSGGVYLSTSKLHRRTRVGFT